MSIPLTCGNRDRESNSARQNRYDLVLMKVRRRCGFPHVAAGSDRKTNSAPANSLGHSVLQPTLTKFLLKLLCRLDKRGVSFLIEVMMLRRAYSRLRF